MDRRAMKASKFTDAQKAFVIKQGEDGIPVAEICRKAGISQTAYFNWKKKYAGLTPPEMRPLLELEPETGRRTTLVAYFLLDTEILREARNRKHCRLDARSRRSTGRSRTGGKSYAGPHR